MAGNRRSLLLTGLALAGVAAAWQIFGVRPQRLAFAPIAGLSGWRRTTGGGLSAAPEDWLFVGLDAHAERQPPLSADALTAALYGAEDIPVDPLPLAVFSDFFCPYCRRFQPRIAARAQVGDVRVHWQELPLRGPASAFVARASVAAGMQAGYLQFQTALAGLPFRPTAAVMRQAAEMAGLDPDRLLSDMQGAEVTAHLSRAEAAAARLGVAATPALVIGRSVVIGELDDGTLNGLIAEERMRLS